MISWILTIECLDNMILHTWDLIRTIADKDYAQRKVLRGQSTKRFHAVLIARSMSQMSLFKLFWATSESQKKSRDREMRIHLMYSLDSGV